MNRCGHPNCTFAEIHSADGTAVVVDYYAGGDVLYVRRADSRAVIGREAPGDGFLILSNDATGAVVLVTILAASELPVALWLAHPDRDMIPLDLRRSADAWVVENCRAE